MRRIHRVLLAATLANEPAVRGSLDPEPLHDFRVAMRRARTALARIKQVFDRADTRHLRNELGWLGGLTGPRRDLDVFLEALPEYERALPLQNRTGVRALGASLLLPQADAQQRLVAALDGMRYQQLLKCWRRLIEPPPEGARRPPMAVRPIAELAGMHTGRALARTIECGMNLTQEPSAAALHALRIEAKKLRYLLEFFRSLAPDDRVGQTIGDLKQIQNSLGEYQDLAVQLDLLGSCSADLRGQPADGAAALSAFLRQRQHPLRDRIATGWRALSATLTAIDARLLYMER